MKSKSFLKYQKKANIWEYVLYYIGVTLWLGIGVGMFFFCKKNYYLLILIVLIFLWLGFWGSRLFHVYIQAGFYPRLKKTKKYIEKKLLREKSEQKKKQMISVLEEIDKLLPKNEHHSIWEWCFFIH